MSKKGKERYKIAQSEPISKETYFAQIEAAFSKLQG